MPYMLRQKLTEKTGLEGTPTWRLKMPALGRYTAIELVVQCNREADRTLGTVVYPIESQIDKIELLEGGSRALLSLSASQLDACGYWDFKRPPARRYRQAGDTGNQLHLFLMGGRDLYDREYGWDFAKMDEVYLEYTHSMSTDATDKFDVSTHTIYVYLWRWMGPDAPSFKGYIRRRQIAVWTTTGTGTLKTIPIPMGNPVRRIAVQGLTRAASVEGTVTKAEILVNEGERSLLTVAYPFHWCAQEVSEYGLYNVVNGIDFGSATTQFDFPYWFAYYQGCSLTNFGSVVNTPIIATYISAPARYNLAGGQTGEVAFTLKGFAFQKCMRLGFDHDYDGFDLLQTRGLGALDLELTETAVSKDAAVFVEDMLTY